MPTMLEPLLRFSDVAFGIDATPKSLRLWLQRDQVDLFSDAPAEGGWRKFPMIDLAILALARRLVDFGINVETASSMANTILVHMQGDVWLKQEHSSFTMFWINQYVVLTPNGNATEPGDATQWSVEIRQGWRRYTKPPGQAFLTLVPGPILKRAFDRAITGDAVEVDDDEFSSFDPSLEYGAPVSLGVGADDTPQPAPENAGVIPVPRALTRRGDEPSR